jgi:hypothetical protein
VHVPPPAQRQRRQLVQYRRTLVARRTRVKNQVRSIFSQQGLPLPRGKHAWTAAGVEEIREQAKELASCGVEELWRGRLHVELAQLESANEQLAAVEAKLDELASSDEKVKLPHRRQGRGPAAGGGGGVLPGRPAAVQDGGAGGQLRGAGPQADRERADEAGGPHHPPGVVAAPRAAGGGGVDGVAAQTAGHRRSWGG